MMETALLGNGTSVRFDRFALGRVDRSVLVDVWREACRHIEIQESTHTISKILAKLAPIGQLLVRKIDRQRSCLETVAVGVSVPDYLLPEARTSCDEGQLKDLLAWCRKRQVLHQDTSSSHRDVLAMIVPPGMTADVVAGALGDPENPSGVVVLAAQPGTTLEESHIRLVEALLEPFSVALENDQRLREMAAMRAAAEADKESLLKRLGRKQLTDTVVGEDSGLQHVVERVGLVARNDAPVLILGETGTGKELIARMIHTRSPRANGPFLRVNCGAIPAELIDSQLFGHERGAFTGAVEARQGWFERANGGTLLLDEIGELPLAAQVRLLRILQDGWMERVGGHEPVHVDVRIVAATHCDLAAMVAEGQFREDLWYRIAVFPIRLPPLRERPEDIPALARHFAERAAVRFVLPEAPLTAEDIQLLTAYPWPGNVRELGAVIDRAAILGNGKRLDVAQALGASERPLAVGQTLPPEPSPPTSTEILSLDAAMKKHIESVLAVTHGRIEGRRGAAALLKINPHTLRARMRKLAIDWAKYRSEEEA
jgi:transcriptional regulator with GAF, ATPase, and Fis domain